MTASGVLLFILASQVSSINDPAPIGVQPSNTQTVQAQLNSLHAQISQQVAECQAAADTLRNIRDNKPQRSSQPDMMTPDEFEKKLHAWNRRVEAQAARVDACNTKLDRLQAQVENLSQRAPPPGRQKTQQKPIR